MYFSQKTLTQVDIVIDSREDVLNPSFKEYFIGAGLKVSVMRLEEGDFYIPSPVSGAIIERKSWNDFANSILDKRIWAQAKRLSELSRAKSLRPYMIIEGDMRDTLSERELPFNALLSVIEVLQRSYNLTVLPVIDKEKTAEWLVYMSKRAKRRKYVESVEENAVIVQKPARKTTIEDRIKIVVRSMAGPILGVRLLKKFGSIKNIVTASLHELMEVEGIGENRAKELYILFNKKIKIEEEW